MKDHRITVRLSDQLHQRLKEAARLAGNRQSDIVRKAVERHFASEEEELTAFERADKTGLIGAVKGAPRDLSTTRKHFEGFGRS